LLLAGNSILSEASAGAVALAIPSGTSISYSYDIIAQTQSFDPTWSLTLAIADEGATSGPATLIGATTTITGTYGSTEQEFTGSGSFSTFAASKAGDILEVYYNLQFSGAAGVSTIVQVPAGSSIDFDTITLSSPAGAPEPSTLGLLGSGLAWFAWKLRKRRQA
jgi:hypothetical protein